MYHNFEYANGAASDLRLELAVGASPCFKVTVSVLMRNGNSLWNNCQKISGIVILKT